jgi:sugar lactone lactonase YvrE
MSEPEVLLAARAETGESPVWDSTRGGLWWVDIPRGEVHLLDPSTGNDQRWVVGQPVGTVALTREGDVLLAMREGLTVASGDLAQTPVQWTLPGEPDGNRPNDGRVDSRGRFWIGTMALDEQPDAGSLYRADLGARPPEIVRMLDRVTISNGIDWSPEDDLMYYADSPTRRVDVFDWNPDAGMVSQRRAFVTLSPDEGVPDGLCVDAEGFVWVALWGGSAVRRYRPDGTLDREVRLPVTQVTSCAFGGQDLDELFITTAAGGLSEEQLAAQPMAGALFRYQPGCQGRQPNRAKVPPLPAGERVGEQSIGPHPYRRSARRAEKEEEEK